MRTTLTLDDDLAERLADLARESRKPFKAVVNETLRRGLGESAPRLPPFRDQRRIPAISAPASMNGASMNWRGSLKRNFRVAIRRILDVIIPDINLLVYAYNTKSPFNKRAAEWWSSCCRRTCRSGSRGSSPSASSAYGPILALSRVRWLLDQAAGHIESWLERPNVRIVNPGPRHAELLFGYLRAEGKGGNLTTDAHLAALAVESRAIIHTADTDFLRFPGVRWHNPLN